MDRETEKINAIFTNVLSAELGAVPTRYDSQYNADMDTINRIVFKINRELMDNNLSDKWVCDLHPVARRRPELGYEIEIRTNFKDGCPECSNNTARFFTDGGA